MTRRSNAAAAVLAGVLLLLSHASRAADSPPPPRRCDLAAYRQHLQQLADMVHACAAQLSSAACDPAQIGPDNEVTTSSGTRLIHYAWLRQTLVSAVKASGVSAKQSDSAGVQLNAALTRLAQDLHAATEGDIPAKPASQVRANLSTILAEHRFQRIQQDPNFLQRAYVAILNWLFERLSKVSAYGGRNPWIAHLLEYGAIIVPCILVTWWVMVRLLKQAAAPRTSHAAAPSAPSAREWQRWLEDAERFAHESQWREAVHHVYWAAISRLESHGLWPADRARTPREYLALVRSNNTLEPELRGLTRSFELIWYGNRPAAEEQYREARTRMERLVPR